MGASLRARVCVCACEYYGSQSVELHIAREAISIKCSREIHNYIAVQIFKQDEIIKVCLCIGDHAATRYSARRLLRADLGYYVRSRRLRARLSHVAIVVGSYRFPVDEDRV